MHVFYALMFTASFVCFLVSAVEVRAAFAADLDRRARFNLVALGLAFFAVPFMWNAWRMVS